jgi:bifunctional aspartokinase / homoserine dehydrogenase 1
MKVMKFGGTSVGSVEAIRQTAKILIEARESDAANPPVAIVSAMGGVTNLLLDHAGAASNGDQQAGVQLRQKLLDRHLTALIELSPDEIMRSTPMNRVEQQVDRCVQLVDSVAVLRDLSPRAQDWIVSFGERLSSILVAAAIEAAGYSSEPVESDRFLVTDGVFGGSTPLMDESRRRAQELFPPMLSAGTIPVVTGFYGVSEAGVVTTLGRGGSDYAATILGALLNSDEVIIWTDVDGVLSADPRLVPEARTLPEISFAEAAELAYFGAKVIHPRTVQPAIEYGMAIWIRNTFNPESPGTRIGAEPSRNGSVKAITAIGGVSVVTVEGAGLIGVAGVTARVFTAVARGNYHVFMISQASSQNSLSFVVRGEDAPGVIRLLEDEFELDLIRQRLLRIWEDPSVAVVAIVGAGMRGTPGVSGRFFQTLGNAGINIVTIAQGSSELNISCVVNESEIARAVPLVHREFALSGDAGESGNRD